MILKMKFGSTDRPVYKDDPIENL